MESIVLKFMPFLVFQILNTQGCPDPLTSIHIYDGPVYLHPSSNHGYEITSPQNTADQTNGFQTCIPGYTTIPDSIAPGCQIIYPGQQTTFNEYVAGYPTVPGNQNCPNTGNSQICPNPGNCQIFPNTGNSQICTNNGNCDGSRVCQFCPVPGQNCPIGGCMPECNCGCKTMNSLPINTACQQHCPGYGQTPGYQYPPNVYTQTCTPGKECTSELLTPNKVLYSKVVDGDIISFTYDIGESD